VTGGGQLAGRVAVVTGVSRRAGIGFGIVQRLLADGASVLVHSWAPHDAEQPWGADSGGADAVLNELGPGVEHLALDLADPDAPRRLISHTVATFGAVDILVCNHARSSDFTLADVTAAELDLTLAVNARAVVLLVQAFAAAHDDERPGGRIVLFTSGQHQGPMTREIPYALSKGAVHQITPSLADAVAERGITVNAVNPGPVDTGWASDELREEVRAAFPAGRWGRPEDIAPVVAWLVSDESAWVTGQVINAEGGFRRGA
jgi:3-oxoacyl-[acyl-carrier protein] reductase